MKRHSLETLLRISQHELDEKRRQIGEALRRYEAVVAAGEELEMEISCEQAVASESQRPADYAPYAVRALQRRDELQQQLAESEEAIAAAREEALEVYREVKKFELMETALTRRERQEESERETKVLDEIATQHNTPKREL